MMIAPWPLLIAVIGLLLYFLASNAKVSETGRILLFCGALVTLMSAATKTVHLF